MRYFTIGVMMLLFTLLQAQTITADFEDFGLSEGEFINEDTSGEGFKLGAVSLPNLFNPSYSSWSGWAISATTDTETPGLTNQYSSIVGAGNNGSITYGVAFDFAANRIEIENDDVPMKGLVNGMYITNSTYSYLSMLEGDAFAKKFGGETGEDPDFFTIVFRGEVDGVLSSDSVEFFLADFRSEVPTEDYILDQWEWVDLSIFGEVDAITWIMRSSDEGEFGINTPLYFCVDDIEVEIEPLNTFEENVLDIKVYPTLADNSLNIQLLSSESATADIISIDGNLLLKTEFIGGKTELDVSQIPNGYYILAIEQDGFRGISKVIIR